MSLFRLIATGRGPQLHQIYDKNRECADTPPQPIVGPVSGCLSGP